MALAATPPPIDNLEDLHAALGWIPLNRVRWLPAPGTAAEADVVRALEQEKRLCELVDGVLVEKPMGFFEARVATVLVGCLERFLEDHDLGIVLGADAAMKLYPGLVRLPDVSFVSWEQLPGRLIPSQAVPVIAPDLAVEVISEGNTREEMERKLHEYFQAGVRLVWYCDPRLSRVVVYEAPERFVELDESGVLTGDPVLPGFRLPVRRWMERSGRRQA